MSKFLAGAIVLVVALAGCGASGNGNDKGASAPATPTKQEYLAKADAICATANKQEAAMLCSVDQGRAQLANSCVRQMLMIDKFLLCVLVALHIQVGAQPDPPKQSFNFCRSLL